MADKFIRTYTFVDGTTAYGSQVEAEIGNIVDVLNDLNTAVQTWDRVSVLHATSVPLIADCSSGSQDIADFKNNNVTKLAIASTGAITGQSTLTLTPTSNQVVLGTTRTVTITAPTPASASRTVTLPDLSADYSVVGTQGTQTISGTKTFDGQLIGKGTATNDSASAGYIGEHTEQVQSATSVPTSGNYGDLTSISLTAGDWVVTGMAYFTRNGATWSQAELGISTTSGNSSSGRVYGSNWTGNLFASTSTAVLEFGLSVPSVRFSLSGTTTVYLKYFASYSVATPQAAGRISARRVR